MKTIMHSYYFHTSDPNQKIMYEREIDAIQKQHPRKCFNVIAGNNYNHEAGTKEVDLETDFLFDNQWNTTEASGNERVFDWFEEYIVNGNTIKRGHWLEITPEMISIRQSTYKCRYCGAHYPNHDSSQVFCTKCIDSQSLSSGDLNLLRLRAVSDKSPFKELSDYEKKLLLTMYKEAQLKGNSERARARIDRERVECLEKRDAAIKNAEAEFNGWTWLLDHGVNIDNVIFYDHTGRFGFGWRHPVDPEIRKELETVLCEFPFDYDIK